MKMRKIECFVGIFLVGLLMFGLVSGAGYNIVVPAATTTDDSSSGGGGGGGDGVVTYQPTEANLLDGYTVILRKDYRVQFNISSENHTLNVNSVGADIVNITVSSEPQTKTLSVGDEVKFELDGDNVYDFSVKLNSISGVSAEFLMKAISEEIPESEVIGEDEGLLTGDTIKDVLEEKVAEILSGKGNFWGWLVGILVSLGVVVGVVVYSRRKK